MPMQVSAAAVALGGGVLIGAGASLLLLTLGRLGGIGGILAGLFPAARGDGAWRVCFAAGLLAGGAAIGWYRPEAFGIAQRGVATLLISGVIVGFGARLGGGCTSGHGICGLSRLSGRALVATATFMAAGVVTVALSKLLGVSG